MEPWTVTKHGREMKARMRRARPWEENSLRAGRRGNIRGATYEQATGEEPPENKGEFGGGRRNAFGRPRRRRS